MRGTTPAGRALTRPKALGSQKGFEPPTSAPMGDHLTTCPGEDKGVGFYHEASSLLYPLRPYAEAGTGWLPLGLAGTPLLPTGRGLPPGIEPGTR